MKKSSFFYFSFAALLAAGFSSCQEEDLGFDEEAVHEAAVLREYQKNFESRYGTIDPNHDWGFKDVYVSGGLFTRSGVTRTATGAGFVNVNRNQWCEKDNNGYKDGALARNVNVPGWTNFDGKYYTVGSDGQGYQILTSEPGSQDQKLPAGDVTDYEIQYVSNWFRTTKITNPEGYRANLHLTDFFVQNVSGDKDRDADGNTIDDIFNQTCSYGMDHLVFKTMDSNPTPDDTWTHLNDYNKSSTNLMNESGAIDDTYRGKARYNNDNTHKRVIMYVSSSGTEDFGYHSSFGTSEGQGGVDGTYFDKWVLVRLTWTEDGVEREGYYLAFDYQTSKDGDTYQGDDFYSNWIIKITPANYKPSPELPLTRIMCEDLGNTLDFDFNDLVFDVKYEMTWGSPNKLDAILVIQAAGGTLPIWVGKKENNYEAHYLLGNKQGETDTPINVAATIKGKTHEVAIVRIPLVEGTDWSTENGQVKVNPNDIKIWVGTNTASLITAAALLPKAGGTAGQSAPKKISIPYTDTRWLKENQQIEWAYTHFDEWVKDETKYGYFTSGTTRNPNAWTEVDKDESYLY